MDNQKCYKTTMTQLQWTAIFAGALVGVGLSFLLNIFGMAIGLSAYASTSNGAAVIAIGGILGLLVGTIASMGAAGFIAGYLSRFYHCYCHGGVIYGFITWSLALILSILLIGPMIHYVSFYEDNLAPGLISTQMSAADANNSANNSANDSANDSVASQQRVPAEKTMHATTPKALAWNGWILFILFFLGALSSCLGSCYGMRCKREELR